MRTIIKQQRKPRKRFNPIVKNLSAIYEISYQVVNYYYNKYNKNIQLTKMHLKRIYQAGEELSFINEINLAY